jgi:hypothetical protein
MRSALILGFLIAALACSSSSSPGTDCASVGGTCIGGGAGDACAKKAASSAQDCNTGYLNGNELGFTCCLGAGDASKGE